MGQRGQPLLNRQCRIDGAGGGFEDRQHRIASHVDDTALIRFDLRLEDAARGVECRQGGPFVGRHQPRKADRVGGKDRRQTVFDGGGGHGGLRTIQCGLSGRRGNRRTCDLLQPVPGHRIRRRRSVAGPCSTDSCMRYRVADAVARAAAVRCSVRCRAPVAPAAQRRLRSAMAASPTLRAVDRPSFNRAAGQSPALPTIR